MKDNKIFWILIGITIFNISAFLLGKSIIEKAADRAIQKLQKEYSPSPYGPGVDPDKLDIEGMKQHYGIKKELDTNVFKEENVKHQEKTLIKTISDSDKWREEWEKSRNANP